MTFNLKIEVPEKLKQPLFAPPVKHTIITGGRGGGKSEGVARAVIVHIMFNIGHVLCTRSVQNSIKDSVYSLLVRLIKDLGLDSVFYITNQEIICRKNNNKIMFKGMNALSDPKSESAKGLNDVKYCWIEEAHTVTENDIDIIIPSIRAEGALFFWTLNSNRVPCYVTDYFENHSNAKITEINYLENRFCPDTLIEEANEMKKINPDKYDEVWLGHPRKDTSKQVVVRAWIEAAIELYSKHPENKDGATIYGLDVGGGGDENALAKRNGLALESLWEWDEEDTGFTANKTAKIMRQDQNSHLVFDRVGIGAGVKSKLKEGENAHIKTTAHSNAEEVQNKNRQYLNTGIKNKDMFLNFGSQQWFYVRWLFENAYRKLNGEDNIVDFITINPNIEHLNKLKLQLTQIEWTDDTPTNKIKIEKSPKGTKSPNLADSVQMCYRKPRKLVSAFSV